MSESMRRRFGKKSSYVDISVLFFTFVLVVFGLIMIYSTTVYKEGTDSLRSQLLAVILGTGVMFVASKVNLNKIPLLWVILNGAASVSIIMLLTPLKITLNHATRWFSLGGMSVQSAEIVKLCLILIMAQWLSQNREELKTVKGNAIAWIIPAAYSGILGIISNNLSSAIIIMGICAAMIILASPYTKFYCLMILAVFGIAFIAVMAVKYNVIDLGFRAKRIMVWLDPENAYSDLDNFQTIQGLYAIGSGGVTGKGIGEGIQKINKIPEAQNDMIFAVLCEELGLVGAFTVMGLFLMLVWRLTSLAMKCRNPYNKLVVSGVAAHIAIQAILNIAVVTNTIPNTGVSLPFISYGGSSVLCLLTEIGLVLNVTRGLNQDERS